MLIEWVLFITYPLFMWTFLLLRFAWLFVFISTIRGFPIDWIIVRCVWSSSYHDYHNGENYYVVCVCVCVCVCVRARV